LRSRAPRLRSGQALHGVAKWPSRRTVGAAPGWIDRAAMARPGLGDTILGNVKRSLHGTYHHLSSKHLPRYLAEFSYRFSRRFSLTEMFPRLTYRGIGDHVHTGRGGHLHWIAHARGCRRPGVERLLGAKRCRERDRVIAMVLERVLHPVSKLAATRLWHTTTLAEALGVGDDDEDDLYEALDWLLERQERIGQRLAKRHLHQGEPVFADVSSSYYEGRTCALMRFGYSQRRQAWQDAARVRGAERVERVSGRRASLSGQHRWPEHRPRPGDEAPGALRARTGRPRGGAAYPQASGDGGARTQGRAGAGAAQ